MVLLISTILLLLVLFISFYWLYSEKNKYRSPKLFSNLEQIRLFFETMPKMRKDIDFKCNKCGHEEIIEVEGIQNFFV